ncbi:MAG: hydrogenase maturation protease [Desulfurococcales archaeon]|nr:hydrogenase maturation protease [Desulfurococcales archaeon]
MKKKIVFLGNNIFLEDKIALVVGEILRQELVKKGFEVEVIERSGVSLIDFFEETDLLIIVDSIYVSREDLYGEVFKIDLSEYRGSYVKSPHNLSIKDVIDILKTLDERYPEKILVIGIGIKDLYTLSDKLSDNLERKLNYISKKILEIIDDEIKI